METLDLHAEAWGGIRRGYEANRLAHAYVLVGSPRGNALQFTESFLKLLFCKSAEPPCNQCAACRQVEAHKHVDTFWLEPQSKARQIKAEEVRDLVRLASQTSFEGGWKACIILAAECMNVQSANVLLKTLEEPPPKTLLLLVTDSPQSLLPTIVSRCQKIVLSTGGAAGENAEWHSPLMDILRDLPPSDGLSAARLASQLKAMFDVLKKDIQDAVEADLAQSGEVLDETKLKGILEARTNARLKEIQADVYRTMIEWQRDVLMFASGVEQAALNFPGDREMLMEQASHHTQASALQAVEVVESIAQRMARNIPDLQNFDEAFRKLVR